MRTEKQKYTTPLCETVLTASPRPLAASQLEDPIFLPPISLW